MRDFTFEMYEKLVKAFLEQSYNFITIEEYFSQIIEPNKKYILMRHDVDRKPQNSLAMAKLEASLGIRATYYFRTIKETFKKDIISQIALLNHEIAYHYESLAEHSGDYKKAIEDFEYNLRRLRELYPVKNIAMHGRPTSKYDSRKLWEKFNYKDYNILSEPYFDIDFNKVLYLTDASRSWDNSAFNLRDKVQSRFNFNFKSSQDIIDALKNKELPRVIMFNIHPEHWSSDSYEWYKTLLIRSAKNFIKRKIVR